MSAIGILLAGGASTRFPSGKLDAAIPSALATLRGRPELGGLRLVDAAHATLAAAVERVLVLGSPQLARAAKCVPDRRPHEGPAAALADLLGGELLRDLPTETRVVILAADAPFAPPLLLGLMAAAHTTLIVADGEPLPLAVDLGRLREAAAGAPFPRLRDLVTTLNAAPLDSRILARLDPLGVASADIDRPEDLTAAR